MIAPPGNATLDLPSTPVALSPDGRWWIFEENGRRVLRRLRESR